MLTTRFASLRILEVDDDFDVADSCALLLKCLGADVRVAYDGETALAVVPEFKPHLALIDIGMPRMDGCETARRLRALPEGVIAESVLWPTLRQRPLRFSDLRSGREAVTKN